LKKIDAEAAKSILVVATYLWNVSIFLLRARIDGLREYKREEFSIGCPIVEQFLIIIKNKFLDAMGL